MLKKIPQMLAVSLMSSLTTAVMTATIFSTMFVPKSEYNTLLTRINSDTFDKQIEVISTIMEEPFVNYEQADMLISADYEVQEEPVVIEEPVIEYSLTEEEINLIALVTMAEAEGEPEEGKRLVIDTILNRVDGKYWPDTVHDVIYQPHQFTSMWNGRVDRCYVKDDIVELVKEELTSRYNSECVLFRTTRYSDYGVPMFQVGHHYFSSYN